MKKKSNFMIAFLEYPENPLKSTERMSKSYMSRQNEILI